MTEESNDSAGPAPDATPASPVPRYARHYTPELAEHILTELETGRSLYSVCRDDGVPAHGTVCGWVRRDFEGFAARFKRACNIGARSGARSMRYSIELGERILREVESGRALYDVCRDEGMPNYSTVRNWTARLREFAIRYRRARVIGNRPQGIEVPYSDAVAERVLVGVAAGRAVRDVCLDDGMPSTSTVYRWVNDDHAGFCARYYAARDAGRARIGRPTLYTRELADRILFELAEGRSVLDICRADGMPSNATVRLWVRENRDGFGTRYRAARAGAEDDMIEEMLEIVDDGRNDWMERQTRDGRHHTVPNRENIQRSRLRYEARRWLLSSALPKRSAGEAVPDPKEEETQAWAAYLKLVDGKSRGLPCDAEPVDEAAWAAFEARFPGFPYGVGKDRA